MKPKDTGLSHTYINFYTPMCILLTMDLMKWLRDLVCPEYDNLLEDSGNLTQLKANISESHVGDDVEHELDTGSPSYVEAVRSALKKSEQITHDLGMQISTMTFKIEGLELSYKTALKQLSSAFIFPDVSVVLRDATSAELQGTEDVCNVRNPETGQFYGFEGIKMSSRDHEYYTYPLDTWRDLLDIVQPAVDTTIGMSAPEVADCDNWSYTTAVYMGTAFHDARKHKQGAIAVASGKYDPAIKATHAYIIVMTKDLQLWVYEPQTNTFIGEHDDPGLPLKYQTLEMEFIN